MNPEWVFGVVDLVDVPRAAVGHARPARHPRRGVEPIGAGIVDLVERRRPDGLRVALGGQRAG